MCIMMYLARQQTFASIIPARLFNIFFGLFYFIVIVALVTIFSISYIRWAALLDVLNQISIALESAGQGWQSQDGLDTARLVNVLPLLSLMEARSSAYVGVTEAGYCMCLSITSRDYYSRQSSSCFARHCHYYCFSIHPCACSYGCSQRTEADKIIVRLVFPMLLSFAAVCSLRTLDKNRNETSQGQTPNQPTLLPHCKPCCDIFVDQTEIRVSMLQPADDLQSSGSVFGKHLCWHLVWITRLRLHQCYHVQSQFRCTSYVCQFTATCSNDWFVDCQPALLFRLCRVGMCGSCLVGFQCMARGTRVFVV